MVIEYSSCLMCSFSFPGPARGLHPRSSIPNEKNLSFVNRPEFSLIVAPVYLIPTSPSILRLGTPPNPLASLCIFVEALSRYNKLKMERLLGHETSLSMHILLMNRISDNTSWYESGPKNGSVLNRVYVIPSRSSSKLLIFPSRYLLAIRRTRGV